MKQVLSLVLFSTPIFFASGQISKNSILAGGQLYEATTTYDYPANLVIASSKHLSYSCSFAKAVEDNVVIGIAIGYSAASKNQFYNSAVAVSSRFKQQAIGFFGRYYKKLTPAFNLFAQCSIKYIYNKQDYKDSTTAQLVSYHTMKAGEIVLMPGISFQLNKWLQLELVLPSIVSVRYQTQKYVDLTFGEAKRSSFVFNSILQSQFLDNFGVGFQVIF